MSKLLVIKTGTTMPELRSRSGDFEDWIIAGLGLGRDQTIVVDVTQGERLPEYHQIAGIVITGSHAMVTDRQDWSEATAEWLVTAAHKQIPTLGICYGHQLLAYALGGQVDDHPKGREVGTIAIQLHATAQDDPLFNGFPEQILVQLSHRQAVLKLPDRGTLLASNDQVEHQAFRYGEVVWGTQFHPEFDVTVTQAYIDYARVGLTEEGQDPDHLHQTSQNTPWGRALLQRFAAIAL